MDLDFKDFCTSSLNSIISISDSIKWSQDNKICVLQKEYIDIFELQLNIPQIVSKTSYERYALHATQEYPTENTNIDINKFVHLLDKTSLYNMVLDPLLGPRLDKCQPIQPEFLYACWSSQKLIDNTSCALLTLTNLGLAQVFICQDKTFITVGNINDFWLEELKKDWNIVNEDCSKQLFQIHKKRAYELHISAITWGQYCDSFCYLIAGHSSGDISIWKLLQINLDNPKFEPYNLMRFKAISECVCSILWYTFAGGDYIFIGYENGQVVGYIFSPQNENVIIESALKTIWHDEDKIKVMTMKAIVIDGNIALIVIKGQYIVTVLLDKDFNILDTIHSSFGSYYITGIEHIIDNEFIITSVSGDITYIKLILKPENKIELNKHTLSSAITTDHFGIFGVTCSKTRAIWAFLTSPIKNYDHLVLKQPTSIKFCTNKRFYPVDILRYNSSKMLTEYWECMDFMRHKVLQQKALPDWPCFSESCSIYELKILYWLSSELDLVIKRQARPVPFDITFTKKLYDLIVIRHILKLFNTVHDKYMKSIVDSLDLRIIRNCREFLKKYKNSETINFLGKDIQDNIAEAYEKSVIVDVNLPLEKCTWCRKSLIDLNCPDNHQFSSCMITLLPTSNMEFLMCPVCERVALMELLSTKPFCIFCDTLLIKQLFKNNHL